MRLVSILDHFIAAALENDWALRKAEFAEASNLSESGCEEAMPMPRNFSKTMSPAPRRPIALVTVAGNDFVRAERIGNRRFIIHAVR